MGNSRFILHGGKFIDPRQEQKRFDRHDRKLKFKGLTGLPKSAKIGKVQLSASLFQESGHVEKNQRKEKGQEKAAAGD
jgi:hypothetical protein